MQASRWMLAGWTAAWTLPASALIPVFSSGSLPDMQMLASQLPTVSLMTEAGDKLVPCSGTMLSANVMLTASHCLDVLPAFANRVSSAGALIEYAGSAQRIWVAQGASNLYARTWQGDILQGSGATAYGRAHAVIRLGSSTDADLALVLVGDVNFRPWASPFSFGPSMLLGQSGQAYRGLPTVTGNKIAALAAGHSYPDTGDAGTPIETTLLRTAIAGSVLIEPGYGRPQVCVNCAPGQTYWLNNIYNTTSTAAANTSGQQVFLERYSVRPLAGDSGGGLFAMLDTVIPRTVLIGVLKGGNLPGDVQQGGIFTTWTPVAANRAFIDGGAALLKEIAFALPGQSALRPLFAHSAITAGSLRISTFDLTPGFAGAWLASEAQGFLGLSISQGSVITGLGFKDALPQGLVLRAAPGSADLLAYTLDGVGHLSFLEAVTSLVIDGITPDAAGSFTLYVDYEPAQAGLRGRVASLESFDDSVPALTWTTAAPVPEAGCGAMLLAGLAGIGLMLRRRPLQGRPTAGLELQPGVIAGGPSLSQRHGEVGAQSEGLFFSAEPLLPSPVLRATGLHSGHCP